jgi:hypothetical protein
MNSQTKYVGLAVLIGLAISSVTAISAWKFDRYDILNPSFLGEWVGHYGVFPFIFVCGTIVWTFRKHGILISSLNLVGAMICIAFLICAAGITAAYFLTANESGASLPFSTAGKDRDYFVSNATQACINKYGPEWKERQLPERLLSEYCACGASNLADATTRDEMIYFIKNGAFAPSLIPKFGTASTKCGSIIYNGTR